MKITKNELSRALRVLGKVVCQTSPVELYRSIRFVGDECGIRAMATDGVETVSVKLEAFADSAIDFCVPFKEIKEEIRTTSSEFMELAGEYIPLPEPDEPTADVISVVLPADFGELLSQAAPIVDRSNYRRVLQGINLSSAGVTVTDGKQLLHLPTPLSLTKEVTIPFPAALLAAKPSEMGTLRTWDNLFLLEVGNFKWYGKLLEGQYPNWRGVIPGAQALNYSITLDEPSAVIDWVKNIPSQKNTNGVELNVMPDGSVTLVSCIQNDYQLSTAATVTGVQPRAVLTLDREIILRMLLQGYTTFKASSDGQMLVLACGGDGQYIAMPIRTIKTNPNYKEEEKMNTQENKVVSAHIEQSAAPQNNDTAVNPLDELGVAIEEFKLKIKAMLDESAVLSRKVKEVALSQKQKERDFIQARRAIERIRMAI
ncbi:MAG: hypothetical protein IKA47_04190 [Oscillospiraceae bacterium]|nr:hypothetical protein [Oscillospiraceae bacterium]